MALRLRRGLKSELDNLPLVAEGELIFTTDEGKLYVGTGGTGLQAIDVTGGGGGGASTLDGLTDTDLTGAVNNDVLTYNAGTNKWEAVAVPGVGILELDDLADVFIFQEPNNNDALVYDGLNWAPKPISEFFNEQQTYKINIAGDDSTIIIDTDTNTVTGIFVGDVTGDLTGNVIGNVFGNLIGDIKGSVFGDDSSVLVDSINNAFTTGPLIIEGNRIRTIGGQSILLGLESDPMASVEVNASIINVHTAGVDGSATSLPTVAVNGYRGTISSPLPVQVGDFTGEFVLSAYTGGLEPTVKAAMLGQIDTATIANPFPGKIVFALHDADGGYSLGVSINSRSHLAAPVMKFTPYTDATERDTALPSGVVEAGMVIYLQSTNKLQINTDSTITGWVDLH